MFPVKVAHNLAATSEEKRFLVENLWAQEAVGIIGGEPKCCKSFMALSLGVSVASGLPCLGKFSISTPGPVLLYPAEDPLSTVRSRLAGICASQGIKFSSLPLYVITAPRIQLDVQADRDQLRQVIERYKPKLLILDPFVRMHSIDENASGEVSALLRHLRYLQRTYKIAIALVHHAKKGASLKRPGQALRGSSDFHAWGDSNLYLARTSSGITLTVEHRSAASVPPLLLELKSNADQVFLDLIMNSDSKGAPIATLNPQQTILALLGSSNSPMRISDLRRQVGLRNETVSSTIADLLSKGMVLQSNVGLTIANKHSSS